MAVGVKVHSISGVVDARSLSRTCRQCGTHFKLGMTTYRTGFYKDVVVPVTLSALPIATEELDSSVGVRAHTITDNQLRVSNHHVFEASLAHLWYLHASQGRFSTETKATVRMSMGAEETLLVESDAFIGDEGDGALNQQIWASIVFYAAQLFEKRRGFNKVAWIPLFDANRAHSSQRLSLHSLCNRMVRVWQTHGYFHARHTYDKCLLPECIDFLVGDGVAMGGIVCGVERCLCPSANSKRFCAEKITNEELCAVVRQSTTLAPCAQKTDGRDQSQGTGSRNLAATRVGGAGVGRTGVGGAIGRRRRYGTRQAGFTGCAGVGDSIEERATAQDRIHGYLCSGLDETVASATVAAVTTGAADRGIAAG